jgi:hypothetical protein
MNLYVNFNASIAYNCAYLQAQGHYHCNGYLSSALVPHGSVHRGCYQQWFAHRLPAMALGNGVRPLGV